MDDDIVEESQQVPTKDRGMGLVEIVVAVSVMAIALIPIMLAAIMTVQASSQSRTAAKVETVLANAADRVNRAGEGCDYDVYVEAAALAQGWEASQAVATYQYFVPASSPTLQGTWQAGACPGGLRPEGLVQLVTISVTSPDGKVHRSMEVVKSDV